MVKNWFSVVHVYLFYPECKSFNEIPKETPYFTTTNDCWKWENLWLNKQSSSPHLSIKHQQLLNCVFDFQQKSPTYDTYSRTCPMFIRSSAALSRTLYRKRDTILNHSSPLSFFHKENDQKIFYLSYIHLISVFIVQTDFRTLLNRSFFHSNT